MKNSDKKNLSTTILIGYEPTAELKETMLTEEKMKNEQMNEERRKIKLKSEAPIPPPEIASQETKIPQKTIKKRKMLRI